MSAADPARANLLGVDASFIMPPRAGFYYVWPQGLNRQ
jgi:protease-4